MELQEIPDALERPAQSAIRITEADGSIRIEIPARGASALMWLTTSGLAIVLLGWIIMVGALVIAGKPILVVGWIANHGITPTLLHWIRLLSPFAILVLVLGVGQLISILRSSLTNEYLEFGPSSIRHLRQFFSSRQDIEYPYGAVRGFLVSVDPNGLMHGTLRLVCQGEERQIAEFLTDRDREWLASVGNALLRRGQNLRK